MSPKFLSNKIQLVLFILLSISFVPTAKAQALLGVQNYNQCLLEATRLGMINSKSDARSIKKLCRNNFPDSAPAEEQLTALNSVAISKIEIYTSRSSKGGLNGTVYNSNSDWTVAKMVVLLTPKNRRKTKVENFFDSEEYTINLLVPPMKTKTFEIPSEDAIKGAFGLTIVEAEGY